MEKSFVQHIMREARVGKEIKKLRNLSENSFSWNFLVGYFPLLLEWVPGGWREEVVVDSKVSSKLNKSSFLINFPSFPTTKNSNER